MAEVTRVDILFFAALAEAVGNDRLSWEGPGDSSVQDVIDWCIQEHPPLAQWNSSMAAAINEVYVNRDQVVQQGDTLALIPPVSGG